MMSSKCRLLRLMAPRPSLFGGQQGRVHIASHRAVGSGRRMAAPAISGSCVSSLSSAMTSLQRPAPRRLQQQQQQQLGYATSAKRLHRNHPHHEDGAAAPVPDPTPTQMKNYFITTAIPMFGFGFMDQTVMIQAGNAIDLSIGVYFGLSTLVAAALGQVVSGAVAAIFGGTLDSLFMKMGLPRSGFTSQQRLLPKVKRLQVTANFIGVVLGCIFGLVNFLFIDTDQATLMKLEALADDAEFAYEIKASNKIRRDATVVTVKGPDISGILASMTTALSESNYDLMEVRALSADDETTTTIDDVIVVRKGKHQVPNDELEELAQLLLEATRSPINLLKAQARTLEIETLKERIEKLETLLREKQIQIELQDEMEEGGGGKGLQE